MLQFKQTVVLKMHHVMTYVTIRLITTAFFAAVALEKLRTN